MKLSQTLVTGVAAIASFSQISCQATSFHPKKSAAVFSKPQTKQPHDVHNGVLDIPRGGEVAASSTSSSPSSGLVATLLSDLCDFMNGARSDTIALLSTTALVAPLCKQLGVSNILGFLAAGIALGPNGIKGGLISDVHRTELLADLGIVFFIFEMGLHINFDTLMSMKNDVFGLGLVQVLLTASAVAGIASLCGLSSAAMIVLGGGIALSSSAFVLQLLKDKKQLDTRHGKSSLGMLIMQDLAVVPLLVVTPLLAGGGDGLGKAFASAGVAFLMAISVLGVCAKFLFDPLFDAVVSAQNQEAFVGLVLGTVLGMSFLTEGLGLSNTLGSFVSGMILAASKHKEKIESEISPFRGVLVGLFFFSVGFEIDLSLITSKFGLVSLIVLGIMALKAGIITGLCRLFGLTLAESQRAGFLLSEVSEFAFVAFRMARSYGILDEETTKLMLTAVSLTMALTPLVEEIGAKLAESLEAKDKSD
jgi:Kef-type K+ transport system membrane component KefB